MICHFVFIENNQIRFIICKVEHLADENIYSLEYQANKKEFRGKHV